MKENIVKRDMLYSKSGVAIEESIGKGKVEGL